jgi:molybdenum cofactor cytidylyltransferase
MYRPGVNGVVGIVLGAGRSTRLGRPKQDLPFGDRTLLEHVVRTAEQSDLDRIVVVVSPHVARPAVVRAEIVANDDAASGCSTSLRTGLDRVDVSDANDARTAAVVLLLGDMPGVGADVIDAVVARWQATPSWAAVTHYEDGIGHPFVFAAAAVPTLRALHGDKAIWKIVEQEPPNRVVRIPVARPRPRDVDTWADYLEVCRAFGVRPAGADGSVPG